MKKGIQAALLCVLWAASARAEKMMELRGRVVDEAGAPVAGSDVCYAWTANGRSWDQQGKPLNLDDEAVYKDHWGPAHLGQMEPGDKEIVKTGPDGRFQIKAGELYHTLVAMDAARRRGGLGIVSKDDPSAPIEIRIDPLVRVRGSIEGPGHVKKPSWTHIVVHAPQDPTRPLDMTRLIGCGSNEARFVMSLPRGRYLIEAQNEDARGLLLSKPLELKGDVVEVDLGVLALLPNDRIADKRQRSQAQGTWGDYTKHYGRKPPAWHVSEARGVSKDVQISDFKGKWVVLDFWGLSCTPCLKHGMPELIAFYEEHQNQRDRFEIVSIFLDPDGETKSLADMDRALEPIVKHVWGGRTILFPILFDNSFKTWESFALPGLGTQLLVNPQGNLVKGELAELAKKLKE